MKLLWERAPICLSCTFGKHHQLLISWWLHRVFVKQLRQQGIFGKSASDVFTLHRMAKPSVCQVPNRIAMTPAKKSCLSPISWECLRRMGQLSLDRHTCRAIHLKMWHGDMLVRRHVLQRLFVNKPSPKPTLREHQNTGFSMKQAVPRQWLGWLFGRQFEGQLLEIQTIPNLFTKKQTKWKMRSCWVNVICCSPT